MALQNRILSLLPVFLIVLIMSLFSAYAADFNSADDRQMMEEHKLANSGLQNMQGLMKADSKNSMMMEYDSENMVKGNFGTGPSYGGYSDSKEHMFYARIFASLGDIDEDDILQHCAAPEKIADILISKLKETTGDFQNICESFEDNCTSMSQQRCSHLGSPVFGESTSENIKAESFACPVKKDSIIAACRIRSADYVKKRMLSLHEDCEKKFSGRMEDSCQRFTSAAVCERDPFIKKCIDKFGIEPEDFKDKIVCPALEVPPCPDGDLRKKVDSNGCVQSYYCEEILREQACPAPTQVSCLESQALMKKVDEKGCVYYYCVETKSTYNEPSSGTLETTSGSTSTTTSSGSTSSGAESTDTSYKTEEYTRTETSGSSTTTSSSSTTDSTLDAAKITGSIISDIASSTPFRSYDDVVHECEQSWTRQEMMCKNMPQDCDKASLIESCAANEKRSLEESLKKAEFYCANSMPEFESAEKRCMKIEEEKERCLKISREHCGRLQGFSEKCRELATEENIKEFLVKEAKKKCRLAGIQAEDNDNNDTGKAEVIYAVLNTASEEDLAKIELFVENPAVQLELEETTVYKGVIEQDSLGDLKLLPFVKNAKLISFRSSEKSMAVKESLVSRMHGREIAAKLASLSDSNVPKEFKYILEDKAEDVLNASESIDNIQMMENKKGFMYKFQRFLGLAKKSELEEIGKLNESAHMLENSIETLESLQGELQDDVARAVIKEQVASLKAQREGISSLIAEKQKKAKGLFSMFG